MFQYVCSYQINLPSFAPPLSRPVALAQPPLADSLDRAARESNAFHVQGKIGNWVNVARVN
jgi:hypothetical protein